MWRATDRNRVSTTSEGEEVEDHIYNVKDFDRTLVLDGRTKVVARKVSQFLKESGDRFQKAIVFCVNQEHAGRMHQPLINENAERSGTAISNPAELAMVATSRLGCSRAVERASVCCGQGAEAADRSEGAGDCEGV